MLGWAKSESACARFSCSFSDTMVVGFLFVFIFIFYFYFFSVHTSFSSVIENLKKNSKQVIDFGDIIFRFGRLQAQ